MKKQIVYAAVALFAASLLTVTGCVSAPDGETDVTAADISLPVLLEKMEKSSDPKNLYRNASSYLQKQELQSVDGAAGAVSVTVMFKRPKFLKTIVYRDGNPATAIIYNGGKAWMIDYCGKTCTELTGATFDRMKVMFELACPGSSYHDVFSDIQLTQCRIDEKEYYRMRCLTAKADQPPFILYIGKNNFLVKKLATCEYHNGDAVRYVSVMDKYALYDGVMIAAVSSVTVSGVTQQYRVVEYKLNPPLADSEFTPPRW